jgi:hypothetical protein
VAGRIPIAVTTTKVTNDVDEPEWEYWRDAQEKQIGKRVAAKFAGHLCRQHTRVACQKLAERASGDKNAMVAPALALTTASDPPIRPVSRVRRPKAEKTKAAGDYDPMSG